MGKKNKEERPPLKIGDHVILEDNMTIFGEMSMDEGAMGIVRDAFWEYDMNKKYQKVAIEWLTGKTKGETDERIFANRFSVIPKEMFDLQPRFVHLEGEWKTNSILRNNLTRIWKRLRRWISPMT